MNSLLVGPLGLGPAQWLDLFLHFAVLSLVAVGGAIATAGDMQRYLVHEQGWLDAAQFNAGVAIAQAAPGPNVLFVAVLGYQTAGLAGVAAAMAGVMLPSSVLALAASRYAMRHQQAIGVQAFHQGLAPLSVGLLLSVGVIVLLPYLGASRQGLMAALLAGSAVLGLLRFRLLPLWLIAAGAAAGALESVM